jgi:hypothetical protein
LAGNGFGGAGAGAWPEAKNMPSTAKSKYRSMADILLQFLLTAGENGRILQV